jgi:excisionase family DNA binding protein
MAMGNFVSVPEAADILGCTGGRVRQLLIAGELPGEKLNARAWAVDRKAVEKMAAIPRTKGRPRNGETEE